MITAVDANVVLDTLVGSEEEIATSYAALRSALLAGKIVISVVSYAEVAQRFPSKSNADDFFRLLNCTTQVLDEESAFLAGQFARQYRLRGGNRRRILPDFLIGAHAQLHADRILTRDKRFFGDTFPKLRAVSPADLA
jgi:predicted nucleic acid-binding protein